MQPNSDGNFLNPKLYERQRPREVFKSEEKESGSAEKSLAFNNDQKSCLNFNVTLHPFTNAAESQFLEAALPTDHQEKTDERWKELLAKLVSSDVLEECDSDACYRTMRAHAMDLDEVLPEIIWELESSIGTPGEREARQTYVAKLSEIRKRHVDELNRILFRRSQFA